MKCRDRPIEIKSNRNRYSVALDGGALEPINIASMVDHRIDFFAANFCVQYIWIEEVAFSPVGLPCGFWEKGGRYGKIEYVVVIYAE